MESSISNAGIYKTLSNIQNELKAPKRQYNDFGKYKYRSAEDILESVKPLCFKHDATLFVTDEIVLIGERYYVKATAQLLKDSGETITTTAYAREDESKKGMDGSQITGAASSYARKYALNGLFCIDDTKDADADEPKGDQQKTVSNAPPDDPGNFVVHAKGKAYDGMTIRQIDLSHGGREILLKMCKANTQIGTKAYEIQQAAALYLEMHA